MERLIVACVQQRTRLPETLDDYRDDLRRFLRVADRKSARLIVFPELAGLMIMPPMLQDFGSTLLKRSDRGKRNRATLWQRLTGSISASAASILGVDLRKSIVALSDVAVSDVQEAYADVFGGLASEFGITIIAPSIYISDPIDGIIRNSATVFGTSGELLGSQSKVVLHPHDVGYAQPGSTWDVIQTDVGRVGIMLGSDVLYPEVGRLLAYQGAEVLISMAACTDPVLFNKVRSGMLARMQDNQIFGVSSFLIGETTLHTGSQTQYMGKSAIFAPQELTPQHNGLLVEMGNQRSEGVITAEWNFAALRELWDSSDTPIRRNIPLEQTGQILAQLYERLQMLPQIVNSTDVAQLPETSETLTSQTSFDEDDVPEAKSLYTLDDLPVLSSVTTRWPLSGEHNVMDSVVHELVEVASTQLLADPEESSTDQSFRSEDETDEMDALDETR